MLESTNEPGRSGTALLLCFTENDLYKFVVEGNKGSMPQLLRVYSLRMTIHYFYCGCYSWFVDDTMASMASKSSGHGSKKCD
jgi:hypothetical protein